jgi:hypothetical protein
LECSHKRSDWEGRPKPSSGSTTRDEQRCYGIPAVTYYFYRLQRVEVTLQGSAARDVLWMRTGHVTISKRNLCNLYPRVASCYSYIMNKQLLILALMLVTAACTPTPTTVPKLPSPALSIVATASATPVPQQIIPATPVQPTETALPATESAGTLLLQVLSPQDEAVVNTQQVDVIGSAPAGAVVTVNDEILIMSTEGQFKTTVALEEGPNLIEILASDENGNEASLLLTVTYEP